jgi:hypothetical protein
MMLLAKRFFGLAARFYGMTDKILRFWCKRGLVPSVVEELALSGPQSAERKPLILEQ